MPKLKAILGSALFFLAAPAVVAGVVPWWITRWEFRPASFDIKLMRIIGIVLITVGMLALLDSFARFALQGLGTPAPIAPTRHLVMTGLYRYVRNPMYIAVVDVVFGQTLLFSDWRLFCYGAVCWFGFHFFIVAYEEPTLMQTYGEQYAAYRANVPRWIPRPTPWLRA